MTLSCGSICVFCGSRSGVDARYERAARELGTMLGERGLELVYGGGNVGLMGALADSALAAGAKVTGIIPEALLSKEVGHRGLTELHVVPNMHVRKRMMAERADAFIALPGGIGTFEELFEVWTWRQLGYHGSPLGLLEVAGYYQPLLAFMRHTRDQGFLNTEQLDLLVVESDAGRLLDKLQSLPSSGRLKLDRT